MKFMAGLRKQVTGDGDVRIRDFVSGTVLGTCPSTNTTAKLGGNKGGAPKNKLPVSGGGSGASGDLPIEVDRPPNPPGDNAAGTTAGGGDPMRYYRGSGASDASDATAAVAVATAARTALVIPEEQLRSQLLVTPGGANIPASKTSEPPEKSAGSQQQVAAPSFVDVIDLQAHTQEDKREWLAVLSQVIPVTDGGGGGGGGGWRE